MAKPGEERRLIPWPSIVAVLAAILPPAGYLWRDPQNFLPSLVAFSTLGMLLMLASSFPPAVKQLQLLYKQLTVSQAERELSGFAKLLDTLQHERVREARVALGHRDYSTGPINSVEAIREANTVCGAFDLAAAMARRRLVNADYLFGIWGGTILHFYRSLRNHMGDERFGRKDHALYKDFEWAASEVHRLRQADPEEGPFKPIVTNPFGRGTDEWKKYRQ